MSRSPDGRTRWPALWVLCIGVLMIVLDTTIVTVALPTIQADLHFSSTALVWVLNAYMLTFGGFLLLGGRLGDLYGRRRWFLFGLVLFTLSSVACGLAHARLALIAARALQGVGGAVVAAVSLSLIMTLFTEPRERARAMGIYGFVVAAGGSIGELLGGYLTQTLGWHSIFLINLPIGIGVYVATRALVSHDPGQAGPRRLDSAGAICVTAALMLAVYAIVNGNSRGWLSPPTLEQLTAALLLLLGFVWIESRARAPLMPLRLFSLRNVATANVVSLLWSGGMFAWFVISALYLQHVLGYDPLHVGLSFLPADLIMMAFSVGLSAQLVLRFGLKAPLAAGLLIEAVALALLARAPQAGAFVRDVLPAMILGGLGAGVAFNPLLLVAMSDVRDSESGLASGLVNTSFMLGGAFGLALLASRADAHTRALQNAGSDALRALNEGYHSAFVLGALLTLAASACAALALQSGTSACAQPGRAL